MAAAGTSPDVSGEANEDSGYDDPAYDDSAYDEAGGAATDEAVPARPVPAQRLDERSRDILAFERRWWRHAGAKEQAIQDTFGLSVPRYYQLLNALLDEPAALAHDPVLVGRLRRLRQRRPSS